MALAGETKSETIAGKTYTTKTLGSDQGIPIMFKLLRLIPQEAMKAIMGDEDPDDPNSFQNDPSQVLLLLQHIAKQDKELNIAELCKELLITTECQQVRIGDNEVPGKLSDHFDTHFAGDYGHLLSVCIWVATVNFFGS